MPMIINKSNRTSPLIEQNIMLLQKDISQYHKWNRLKFINS